MGFPKLMHVFAGGLLQVHRLIAVPLCEVQQAQSSTVGHPLNATSKWSPAPNTTEITVLYGGGFEDVEAEGHF